MKRYVPAAIIVLSGVGALLGLSLGAPQRPKPSFYVGSRVCMPCHGGKRGCDQYSLWRLSKHAKAYAALSLPESFEVAEISGVDVPPRESPICLGCHATASTAEPWQLDPTFHREDGVQCEVCHGPASNHVEAMRAGKPTSTSMLPIPRQQDCVVCHRLKDSHRKALDSGQFDYKTGLQEISHTGSQLVMRPSAPTRPTETRPYLVGVSVCAQCHSEVETGAQFAMWMRSAHANAYATLGTSQAWDAAAKVGIQGNPQANLLCLRCHAAGFGEQVWSSGDSFEIEDGVQCESCHGPGSEYSKEAIMRDKQTAVAAALEIPDEKTCLRCHNGQCPLPSQQFDFGAATNLITHPRKSLKPPSVSVEYKTPFNLVLSRDGRRAYVACEGSNSLVIVDLESHKVVGEVEVGRQPHGVCLNPAETIAYVTNRSSDTVSVVDLATNKVTGTIAVGDEPHGIMTDVSGDTLYVGNGATQDVSVIDAQSAKEVKRLSAARGAWGVERSPDGKFVYVTNNLSHFVPFRTTSMSEVTVIDTQTRNVVNRIRVPETNLVQGVAFSPDGEFALVTMLRTKNVVPMTRVIQGWVITNGLAIIWKNGRVDEVLLDEPNSYFADPTDVVITPDGKYAYVTGGGIDAVAVVDLPKLLGILRNASEEERVNLIPNHLGIPTEFVVRRIPTGSNPRGLVVSPDGKFVYVAAALDDDVTIIDTNKQEVVGSIDLGGAKEITQTRFGERLFHDADITFQRQFSCHSCHPDGNVDGLTYDIEPDGLGVNPVDNRTLRGIHDTPPFKWSGKNPSLSRQCGARLAVFFTRVDPFTPEELAALDRYVTTIPRPPNRYQRPEGLTPAQSRGKAFFERTITNGGRPIPPEGRCVTCHPAPYYTSLQKFDVGTKSWLDTDGAFDVPHLNNIYEAAPYLHDGRAETLEEIWTRYNPKDQHGVVNDMTKDQLNDLIEYLRSL
ncbi:MAG: multiheme c-type cytochrome [bacterium]|nr:multiheme c-type cytochrome [bacterium]